MTDSTINHFSEEICSECSASRNIVADWLKTHQAELIRQITYLPIRNLPIKSKNLRCV